jgi:superfamily I DNA/RNA helicase
MENSTILSEYDMIEGIKVLSEGLLTVEELVNRINTIFSGTNNEGIALSTIHKAKGLESDNVYILYPSLLNPRKDLKDWEKIVERNLTYVAYTRAKKTLNFIKEDYSNKFLYNNDKTKKEIKDNIIDIMKKLNFNIENKITENNTIRSQKVQKHLGDRSDGFTYTLEYPSETKKKTPLKKFKFI